MLQYKVTQCGAAVQEPLMWCCSKGHTMWYCSTNISYFKHFNINTVLHFFPPLALTPYILTTIFAMQLGSYRHNVRYTRSLHLSKWHYAEEHNNPGWQLRWWRGVWYNRQGDFDDVWTNTATSTYCYLSAKHIATQQRNAVFGFSPKSISVPNAQTWLANL
jgi:hypothetical protein